MRLGVYVNAQHPAGDDPGRRFAEMVEQVRLIRTLGFDSIWGGEHHATPGYHYFPLLPLLQRLAAEADGLWVGTNLILLPLHNPVEVAEIGAFLDVITGGRFLLGVGLGYRPEEFAIFGVPMAERVSRLGEGIEIIRRLWTEDDVTHHGRHWRLDGVTIRPRPVQQPRPPIFLGGSTRAAARRAARIADYLIPSTPEVFEMYRAELTRLGKPDPGPLPASTGNFVHVAEDPDAAWRHIAPHALHETNAYGRWLADAGLAGPYRQHRDADSLRASGQYLVLTPDELVARARALGPTATITLHPLMGGLHPDHGWESLRLVVEKVMPALAQ